jgi:hypothetical protein
MPFLSPRRILFALTLAALLGLPTIALAREAGMLIDPNGSPAAATPNPTHVSGEAGMPIDPDGSH